jgi:uncharacterized repeat protein (TIGR03837 family)
MQPHENTTQRDFLARVGLPIAPASADELLISLFCYEPPLLGALLQQLTAAPTPVRLLVTAGRATQAVHAWVGEQTLRGALHIDYLPVLSQQDFDALLWHCDINCVRGEDSVVRAIWAGKPFVWHIYPQHDQAHAAKLEAFLEQMQLGAAVRQLHRAWNGLLPAAEGATALLPLKGAALLPWQVEVRAARARLFKLDDLGHQLHEFVLKNR